MRRKESQKENKREKMAKAKERHMIRKVPKEIRMTSQKARERMSPSLATCVVKPGILLGIAGKLHRSNVASESMPGSTVVQGSPSSSLGGVSSASQYQSGAQQLPVIATSSSSTQQRVSRIYEINEDVSKHDDLVFDLRDSSPSSFGGGVHVVYHYIGDTSDDSCCEELCNGVIRTVVSGDGECSEQLHSILIDSGADASIFPASLIGLGKPAEGVIGKLCDAQGVEIPVDAVQDMEIRLKDISGRTILLRERVAISDKVNQPILCSGHLLQSGWGISGSQQALVHDSVGAHIPVEMQNQSLIVHGTIRALKECSEVPDNSCVRAIQAEVIDSVLNGAVGWELDSRGCGIGRHFAEKYKTRHW